MNDTPTVRIGGACAGYGDGTMATPQLVRDGSLDYVILDYLSEVFMPQAGRMRAQDPNAGYVPYFPDELFTMAHFVGVTRPGHPLTVDGLPGEHVSVLEVPALAISSTDIRARARVGKPVWYLVPDGVVQYIAKHGLYRGQS